MDDGSLVSSLSSPYNYYNDLKYSLDDSISFWNDVSNKYNIHWDKPYNQVLNYNCQTNKSEWFKGGLINACYNALDMNIINGKKDQVVFIHELPIKEMRFTITYQQLYDKVCIFSRALRNLGVKKSDVVMIYMHNSIETIIVMLSCARIGAIHSVMFGGALSDNLASSIQDCKPKVIVTSNFGFFFNESPHYYLPILQEALLKSSHKPNNIIIYNRKDIPDIDYNNSNLSNSLIQHSLDWEELIKDLEPLYEYEPVESQHPLYLIYSSGTTNKPKGIVRETGGQVVVLNYATRVNYKLNDGDTYYSGANFGWISAHSFLIYGILFVGGKSVFLEGSFRNPIKDYFEIISRNKSNLFLATPILVRTLRKIDPEGELISKYDLSSVRFVSLGGEKVHQSIIDYLVKAIKKPILNEFWQTEQGWQMLFNPVYQFPVKKDSIGKVAPGGYQLRVVKHSDEDKSKVIELGPNQIGEIVIKLPLPPLVTNNLFNDDSNSTLYKHHYLNKYPGYFLTGDLAYYDEEGYYFYISREGDSLSVGASSIHCNVVEHDILNNQQINECCIIGIKDEILSQVPLVLIVLKEYVVDKDIIESIKFQVSNHLKNILHLTSALNSISVLNVKSLPKNRNGKTLKNIIKSIFNGETFDIPSTMDNKDVIYELIEEKNKFYNNINYQTQIN